VIDLSVKNKMLSTFYNYVSVNSNIGGDSGVLSEDRGVEKPTETKHSGHTPRSGPKVKNGISGAKDGAPRGSDAGQSRVR